MQPGAKTVLPAEATAKISMRLVLDQDPGRVIAAFQEYARSFFPEGVSVSFVDHGTGAPVQVSMDSAYLEAGCKALEKGFGKRPVLHGEGGSIPVIADFKSLLGLDTILMGFNLPDDRIHAPNERFLLDHYQKGIVSSIYFYNFLSIC